MIKFFGNCYRYPTPAHGTVTVGVCQGLGDRWIVGYSRPGSASTRRIKTPLLPESFAPEPLQQRLDAWAAKRKLQKVEG